MHALFVAALVKPFLRPRKAASATVLKVRTGMLCDAKHQASEILDGEKR